MPSLYFYNKPSLWKNEFDDIFFFHDELSSYAVLSILSQFQKISPWSFLNRGRFIPSLKHFLNFYNIEAFGVKKTNSMTYYFFHAELSNYATLSILSQFQKISPWSFLSRGRFILSLKHFLNFYNIEAFIVKNEFDDILFFHDELSSYAMLSISWQFQKISSWNFLNRGRFIPSLKHFLNFYNIEAFIVKKRIRWHIIFSWWIIFLCYAQYIITISKDFTVKFS